MTEDFRRHRPLVKCPHASRGRGDKTCRKKSFKDECLKTHFSTFDEWLQSVTSWMSQITFDCSRLPHPSEADMEGARLLHEALEERIEACIADERLAEQDYVL